MGVQFQCKSNKRREQLRGSALNGIDYLEVRDLEGSSPRPEQRLLRVHFINPLPETSSEDTTLTKDNVRIDGGERIRNIKVEAVLKELERVEEAVLEEPERKVLNITVDKAGDFSTYTLSLVKGRQETEPPEGFDRLGSQIDFSFKVECPSEFDCRPSQVCPPEKLEQPVIDYLAKDYASFRQLMLDRLSVVMPDWRERNPADVGIAMVEVLAYVGDYLSCYQDAVATEAYLGTARKRVSVRRHARLLDYPMHEGTNARAWVCFEVDTKTDGYTLKQEGKSTQRRTRLLTRCAPGTVVDQEKWEELLGRYHPEVFEPLHDVTLFEAHNKINFFTWGETECCLPKGATRASLLDDPGPDPDDPDPAKRLKLRRGDVLIFQEVARPGTRREEEADPTHRHAVRLNYVRPEATVLEKTDETTGETIEERTPGDLLQDPLTKKFYVEIGWDSQDALPFPLCLSTELAQAEISVARGNVVLVDHGRTIKEELRQPPAAREQYRPRLEEAYVTHRVEYDHKQALSQPAAPQLIQDPRAALPAVKLLGDGETWMARRDLLGSGRFAPDFVVEMEDDGSAQLRFGDGEFGKRPSAALKTSHRVGNGTAGNVDDGGAQLPFGDGEFGKRPSAALKASYRVGNGTAGNVGAGAIAHVFPANPVSGAMTRVWNPLPARGGTNPETIDEVRLFSPQAFRTQKRAVTEADYVVAAEGYPGVQRAEATRRWTGSWYTMFVTVDRAGGREVDSVFERDLRAYLEKFRLAGYDLEVDAPIFIPLDIAFTVCVTPGYFRSNVKQALLEVFSSQDLPDGRRGFFHPDNFTFGQSVYLSQMVAVAMEVPGVQWVDTDDCPPKRNRFRRWGEVSHGERDEGLIRFGRLEIARLDNDPNAPENGKLEFFMEGGL